jgi:hypothetical protein
MECAEKETIKFILRWKIWKKESFGRPRRRWENNIIKDLREIGWEGLEWIHLAQDKDRWGVHENTVMNLRVA